MFDITKLSTTASATNGARMVIRHPATKQPLTGASGEEACLLLAGMDSEQYRAVERAQNQRRIDRRMMEITVDEIEAERMERLCACTLRVEGLAIGGTPIDATDKRAVAEMYRMLPWLRDEADAFIANRAHFLGA